MKKIIVFINSFKSGGSNKVGVDIASLLNASNPVKLIALYDGSIGFMEINGIKNTCLSKNSSDNFVIKFFLFIQSFYSFYQEIKIFQPERVITSSMETTLVALITKLLFRKYVFQIIMIQHENAVFINNFTFLHGYVYKLFLYIIKSFQDQLLNIICISRNVKETLIEFGFDSSKLKLIYNSINTEKIKQMSLEDFALSGSYIVSVGTLSEIKNQLFLLRSFALIKNDIDEGLIFLGNGINSIYFQKMLQEIEVLGIKDRVQFLDFSENPYKFISKSRVLCSTSFTESFGLTILEAMALGVPVLSTSHEGALEIFGDNSEKYISPFNEEIFSKKLSALLKNHDMYFDFQKKGLQQVNFFSSSIRDDLYSKIILT